MDLSDHQRFMLEALGRHGASILLPKPWSDVGPRLAVIWMQSPAAKGAPWVDVEPIVKQAWLDELRKFADTHREGDEASTPSPDAS